MKANFIGGPLDGRELEIGPELHPSLLPVIHQIVAGVPRHLGGPPGRYELEQGLLVDWHAPRYAAGKKREPGRWFWMRGPGGAAIEPITYRWTDEIGAQP